jgi:hypothetical protein
MFVIGTFSDPIVAVSSVPSFSNKVLVTTSNVLLMNTNEKDTIENSWTSSECYLCRLIAA